MGDPRKSRKKWEPPTHPWIKDILLEEMRLLGEYGLRSKKELWIAKSFLRRVREQARKLLALPPEQREQRARPLIHRLYNLGILPSGDATLDDILRLTIRDVLERRLQTVVYRKGLASSMYHSRQLIVHGHIAIGGRRVRSPGMLVTREEEALVDYYPFSPVAKKAQAGVSANE